MLVFAPDARRACFGRPASRSSLTQSRFAAGVAQLRWYPARTSLGAPSVTVSQSGAKPRRTRSQASSSQSL